MAQHHQKLAPGSPSAQRNAGEENHTGKHTPRAVGTVYVFRPTFDAWLGRVILGLLFLAVLGITALNLADSKPALMWLVLLLLASVGLVGGIYAAPVVLGRIVIDGQGITANVDGLRLKLSWRMVRAVQIMQQDREPYLMLGVSSGLYLLPLHHFRSVAIWKAILQVAPFEAVQPDAFMDYERKDANEGIPPEVWMVGALRVVDYRGLAIAAGLGAAGFALLFSISLARRAPEAPVYLALSAAYLLALTGIGSTELDPQGITRRTVMGTSRILWDDLNAVETGPFSLRVVLEGMHSQRLALFGPPMWVGADAVRAVHFYTLQISTRRLPRRRSMAALFKISRDTRIGPQ